MNTWLKSLKELDRNNLYKKEFEKLENMLKVIDILTKNIVLDMQGNLVGWHELKDEKEKKFLRDFLYESQRH